MKNQAHADLGVWAATAEELARGAGQILMQMLNQDQQITHKGQIDLVTAADLRAEAYILDELQRRFPDHGFLSEERGSAGGSSACKWIIDPLDGTTNFAHNLPYFAVSIALEVAGELTVGVVYNPVLDELFAARRGEPATLNGRPISVSRISDLGKGLLSTGFPYDVHRSLMNVDDFVAFLQHSQSVRRAGSVSFDLGSLAAGRFDGVWQPKLAPWDLAAGALIVQQAGGRLSNYQGGPFSIYDAAIVASNGLIHQAMLDVLNRPAAAGSG